MPGPGFFAKGSGFGAQGYLLHCLTINQIFTFIELDTIDHTREQDSKAESLVGLLCGDNSKRVQLQQNTAKEPATNKQVKYVPAFVAVLLSGFMMSFSMLSLTTCFLSLDATSLLLYCQRAATTVQGDCQLLKQPSIQRGKLFVSGSGSVWACRRPALP